MALIMTTSKWPLSASDEVGKVFLDVWSKQQPDYVKRREVLITAGGEDGLKSYLVMEYEDEHLNDGLIRLSEDMATYRTIPGFTYCFETLMGPEAAVSILGLKL